MRSREIQHAIRRAHSWKIVCASSTFSEWFLTASVSSLKFSGAVQATQVQFSTKVNSCNRIGAVCSSLVKQQPLHVKGTPFLTSSKSLHFGHIDLQHHTHAFVQRESSRQTQQHDLAVTNSLARVPEGLFWWIGQHMSHTLLTIQFLQIVARQRTPIS